MWHQIDLEPCASHLIAIIYWNSVSKSYNLFALITDSDSNSEEVSTEEESSSSSHTESVVLDKGDELRTAWARRDLDLAIRQAGISTF